MKVINEKDYVFVRKKGLFYIFKTNPTKKNFDEEYLYVKRARYIRIDGSNQFYDYIKCSSST